MLGIVDLRDHTEVLLVAAADGRDQLLVVRTEADARLGQPLRVDRGDGPPEATVLLQQAVEHRAECVRVLAQPLHLALRDSLETLCGVAERSDPHQRGAPEVAGELLLEGGGKRCAVLGFIALHHLRHLLSLDAGQQAHEHLLVGAPSLHGIVQPGCDERGPAEQQTL